MLDILDILKEVLFSFKRWLYVGSFELIYFRISVVDALPTLMYFSLTSRRMTVLPPTESLLVLKWCSWFCFSTHSKYFSPQIWYHQNSLCFSCCLVLFYRLYVGNYNYWRCCCWWWMHQCFLSCRSGYRLCHYNCCPCCCCRRIYHYCFGWNSCNISQLTHSPHARIPWSRMEHFTGQ